MTPTLTEEFLLLVLDDESGKQMLEATKRHPAVGGATLVELTLDGALELAETDAEVKRGRFRRTGQAEPSDPLVAAALADAHGRKPKQAIERLTGPFTNKAKKIEERLLRRLEERGVLRRERRTRLGLFPTTRWLPGDDDAEARVRGELSAALDDPGIPNEKSAALISLLYSTGVITRVFPDRDRRALKARAKEVDKAAWAGTAVKKCVDATNAALVAAGGAAASGGS